MSLFGFKKRTYYDGLGVATDEIGSNYFQLVKVTLGDIGTDGLPVSSTNPMPITLTTSSVVNPAVLAAQATMSVTTSSSAILAQNVNRKGGYIVNVSDTTIYISLNTPATVSDIPLYASGGVFQLTLNHGGQPITNQIYAIHGGTGSKDVVIIIG